MKTNQYTVCTVQFSSFSCFFSCVQARSPPHIPSPCSCYFPLTGPHFKVLPLFLASALILTSSSQSSPPLFLNSSCIFFSWKCRSCLDLDISYIPYIHYFMLRLYSLEFGNLPEANPILHNTMAQLWLLLFLQVYRNYYCVFTVNIKSLHNPVNTAGFCDQDKIMGGAYQFSTS